MDPLISVIIPVYNDGKWLDESIESVCSNKYSNYEIIIVNDGSTDPYTLEILDKYKEKYTVINQENKGSAGARNTGLKNAKGKYFIPLDADNKISHLLMTECVKVLEKNESIGVVYTDRFLFGEQKGIGIAGEFSKSKLIFTSYIDTLAVYRKQIWDEIKYDENLPKPGTSEDWAFHISIAAAGWKHHYIPKPLYYYRVRKNSTGKKGRSIEYRKKILEYMWKKNSDFVIPILVNEKIDQHMTHLKQSNNFRSIWIDIPKEILFIPYNGAKLIYKEGFNAFKNRSLFYLKAKSTSISASLQNRKIIGKLSNITIIPAKLIEKREKKGL